MIITLPFTGVSEVEKDGKKVATHVPPKVILQNAGPIIRIMITHPQSVLEKLAAEKKTDPSRAILAVTALIDTGAFATAITPKVADHLGLLQTGFQKVTSVNNEEMQPQFYARLIFPWGSGKEVQVISCPLKGIDCLIGRDILQHWHLTYNGPAGILTICD